MLNYEKKVEQRGFVATSPEIFTNDEGHIDSDRVFFDDGPGYQLLFPEQEIFT